MSEEKKHDSSCKSCGSSAGCSCESTPAAESCGDCGKEPCACAASDLSEKGECVSCGSEGEVGSECCGAARTAPPAAGSGDKEEVPGEAEEEEGNEAA